MSNVIYVGHIPDGFVEADMWKYFSQFGILKRLKLFRSKKTGKSKGFAFVHFRDSEVAKIVAGTMNNYLMFNKILKCHVVPKEKMHANMFKNWNKICRPDLLKHKNLAVQNGFKTDEQIETMRKRLAGQIRKQNRKLADFGIDYSFPVTWDNNVKDEVESIKGDIDDSALSNEQSRIFSEYSMIVDSSDEEISLKTPEQAVKRSKIVKDDLKEELKSDVAILSPQPKLNDLKSKSRKTKKSNKTGKKRS